MQKKIYFIHNSYTWYREPLFIKLSEICNIKFFFTKLWKNGYEEISHDCYSINKNLDHEVVKNRFHIAWPVFGHLIKDDYDSVLVTAMDNWHQTFEAFVSAAIARLRGKRAAYFWEKWDKGWLECEKRNWKTHEISFLRYLWRIRRFYVKRIELRLLSHLADSFVPVGSYSKEYFINCGVKEEKIYIAPEASEIFYDRIKTREEMGMSKDRLIILFMARLIKLKGIDQLLEAYSKLEKEVGNVELYVGGDGAYMQKAKERAAQLHIERIVWTGSIQPEERQDYYANCDLFVLPNYDPDIWATAVNEAMQFGKPVIVSNMTGCGPDLVKTGEQKNGFIVKSGDSGELYQAMLELATNEEFRNKCGICSKDIIKDYTYEKMASAFKKALEG